jgi:serine/threonine protein kinase
MNLDDLSASELARIDAICMDYESRYRSGEAPAISDLVADQGGEHADLLRTELELVREELLDSMTGGASAETKAGPTTSAYFDPVELPREGTEIGPYVVQKLLGRGGMGVVFEAIDRRLDRKVAIKVLAVEIAKRRDLTERFEREARAVAAISHPNIVELFDVGVAAGLPYAVMEYLDGEPLDVTLQRGPLDAEEVRRIGAQIADALATAHEANVVHRDLKPHNIMLVARRGGESGGGKSHDGVESEDDSTMIKLFDFGLSRAPQHRFGQSAEETGDGIVLGTPGYMAPEQARGEVVTPAADIFSLGCVLFEAFYGQRAFEGRTNAARFTATLNHHPEHDPVRRQDDVELAELIERCLQKDVGQRPPSAGVIARQLRQHGPGSDSGTEKNGSGHAAGPVTRRRFITVACGGLAGAAAGAIVSRGTEFKLFNIRSIAVLSFTDESSAGDTTLGPPQPIGDSKLRRGEKLSALLVHELTRLSEVTVPPFRPLIADRPSDYRDIGRMLEVDALVAGNMRTVKQGSKEFLELNIHIVSANTGKELWGKHILTDSGDNSLEQSKLATEIASVIGHRLTSTADEVAPPSVETFSCLVDAKTRSDPDSKRGLEMALMCFQHAHDYDPRLADPIAGIALTSITLAAQTGTEESLELVIQAREASAEALQLDPNSIEARLALAMLDWQTVSRFRESDRAFQELVVVAENNWQVHHQYGLLQLATGRLAEASRSLREASHLNPMSVVVKVDRARAAWYSGDEQRAMQDAIRIRNKHNNSPLVRGLLVDIYEHQSRYVEAAAEHEAFQFPDSGTPEDYFRQRARRLIELPYGPYGVEANAAILQSRVTGGIDNAALAELADPPMPPMLGLLLAVHPSFASARDLPAAADVLPGVSG